MDHSRRNFIRSALLAAAAPIPSLAAPATPTPAERNAMEGVATAFMKEHSVPGLSLAVARHGELVYEEAFGFADRDRREKLTPSNLFRIASVSKPFTSVGIFLLIEQGKLQLDNLVFGPGGLLRGDFGEPPYKQYVGQIRLRHLLTHTCGGWQNDGSDPMFRNPEMNHKQLITWALANVPLKNPPGEHYAYSNFGYCILGRVIEKATGQPYEKYIRQAVFERCDIRDMRIGGNTRADRAVQEVIYYGQGGQNPYDMNVRRMDSHGGWLATAADLVRFAVHVDGFPTTPDILKPASIREMTTASEANPGYAKGWAVNKFNNWWHGGSLPGTTTIMVRTASGYCWSALANSRESGGDTGGAVDRMMWELVRQVKSWDA
ncbi:MAG TPA: serine hydrolase domain-containing protein [Bryobacteraceae bacterium]|nr:serine hydrolase domain-containing protein [Bryobacteraceae bacterium]